MFASKIEINVIILGMKSEQICWNSDAEDDSQCESMRNEKIHESVPRSDKIKSEGKDGESQNQSEHQNQSLSQNEKQNTLRKQTKESTLKTGKSEPLKDGENFIDKNEEINKIDVFSDNFTSYDKFIADLPKVKNQQWNLSVIEPKDREIRDQENSTAFKKNKINNQQSNFRERTGFNEGGRGFGRGVQGGRGTRNYQENYQERRSFGEGSQNNRSNNGFGRGAFQRNEDNYQRGGRGGRGRGDIGGYNNRGCYNKREGGGRGWGYQNDRNPQNHSFRGSGYENENKHADQQQNKRRDYGEQKLSETQHSIIDPNELSMLDSQTCKSASQFKISTTMAHQPIGTICWPTVQVHVKRSRLALILSKIIDHRCSVMFFPYSNYSMDIYPDNIINRCPFQYKKKLREKNKPIGESYLQRCIGIANFQIFSFVKVTKNDPSTVAKGIRSMFQQISKISSTVSSILIPYSKDLGPLSLTLPLIFEFLENSHQPKEIIISTCNPEAFAESAAEFLLHIKTLTDSNEVMIQ